MLIIYKLKYLYYLKSIESQKEKLKNLSTKSMVFNLHSLRTKKNNKEKNITLLSIIISIIERKQNQKITQNELIGILGCIDNLAINTSPKERLPIIQSVNILLSYFQNKNINLVGAYDFFNEYIVDFSLNKNEIKIQNFNDFLKNSYYLYKKEDFLLNEDVFFENMEEFIEKSSSPYIITRKDYLRKSEKKKIIAYSELLSSYEQYPFKGKYDSFYDEHYTFKKVNENEFFLEIEPHLRDFEINKKNNYPDKIHHAIDYLEKLPLVDTNRLHDIISLTNLLSIYGKFNFIGNCLEEFGYESYFLYRKNLLNLSSKHKINLSFLELQNQREKQISYDLILNDARRSYYFIKKQIKQCCNIATHIKFIFEHNKTDFYKKNQYQNIPYLEQEFTISEIIEKSYDAFIPEKVLKEYLALYSNKETLSDLTVSFESYLFAKYNKEIKYGDFVVDKMWTNFLNLFEYSKKDAFLSQYSRKKEFDVLCRLTFNNFETIFIKNFLKFFQ